MRLLILTRHPELPTPRRLEEAGAARGHQVMRVVPRDWAARRVAATSALDDPWLPPRGEEPPLLLARLSTFAWPDVLRSWREWVRRGARPLQSRRQLLDAGDQARTLRRLRAAGVPAPEAELVRRPSDLERVLARFPRGGWYLKGRRGSQGSQVLFARTPGELLERGRRLWGLLGSFVVEPDERARGRIERHLIAADRVIAAAISHPAPAEHRSNAHRGGRFEPIAAGESAAAAIALRAVHALGLTVAAVDTIGASDPLVLEVNASAGIESLERATGLDLATPMIDAWCAAYSGGGTSRSKLASSSS